ncbi:MAG: outer membrane lipid asymmetry maintenance protein MlaD [Polyangiaceae bacterium]
MPAPHTKTEVAVGAFVTLGIAAIGYLSISIGNLDIAPRDRYVVRARFASVTGLKQGAPVRIAGVRVGAVTGLTLKDYQAEAELSIRRSVELPKDTIASIRTEGLLGNAFVSLSPGGSLESLRAGELVAHTEPAQDLGDLLSRYAFGARGGAEAESPDGGRRNGALSDPLR